MPKLFKKLLNGKFNLQESYPTLILGAIIVVILGLLVANFLTKRGTQDINTAEKTQQSEQEAIAPKAGSEYTIRENDSLSKIAEQVYGSQDVWPTIAKVNNVSNPNRILIGNKLQLPPKEEITQSQAAMTQTTYQVQSGDTYFEIAVKMYRDGSKWTILDRANGSRRLPNGNPLVFADTTIVVPR